MRSHGFPPEMHRSSLREQRSFQNQKAVMKRTFERPKRKKVIENDRKDRTVRAHPNWSQTISQRGGTDKARSVPFFGLISRQGRWENNCRCPPYTHNCL